MQREYALFATSPCITETGSTNWGLRGEYNEFAVGLNTNNVANGDYTTPVASHCALNRFLGHEFSPRVSAQYKFQPTANVYAAICAASHPVTWSREFIIHPFRPEIATQYEVGYRVLAGYGVQLNAALFYTTIRTVCTSTSVSRMGQFRI